MRAVGVAKQLQIQNGVLKVNKGQPDAYYDPQFILPVDGLRLSSEGVIGLCDNGDRIVDIHNARHPTTRNNGSNAISIGLTGHYTAMQQKFGDHVRVGVAGENIIIEAAQPFRLADLGSKVAFENPDTGERIALFVQRVVAPCTHFSEFCMGRKLNAEEMKATLQFLHDGTRGFMLDLVDRASTPTLRAGYRFLIEG